MTTETNYAPAPATAQTRFNASSRVDLSNPQGDKVMSTTTETTKDLQICDACGTLAQCVDSICDECFDKAHPTYNRATPTQGEHTPLPWKTANRFAASKPSNWKQEAKFYQYITTEQSDPVFPARTEAEARMNAAFIVKAVNNHEKLKTILRRVYEAEFGYGGWPTKEEIEAVLAEVQEA